VKSATDAFFFWKTRRLHFLLVWLGKDFLDLDVKGSRWPDLLNPPLKIARPRPDEVHLLQLRLLFALRLARAACEDLLADLADHDCQAPALTLRLRFL
jgi:hypothetical protein